MTRASEAGPDPRAEYLRCLPCPTCRRLCPALEPVEDGDAYLVTCTSCGDAFSAYQGEGASSPCDGWHIVHDEGVSRWVGWELVAAAPTLAKPAEPIEIDQRSAEAAGLRGIEAFLRGSVIVAADGTHYVVAEDGHLERLTPGGYPKSGAASDPANRRG